MARITLEGPNERQVEVDADGRLQTGTKITAIGRDGVERVLTKDDIAGPRSLFNEQITTERTPLIELNATFELSVLREVTTVANTGAASTSGGEHNLSTGATTASTVQIQTTERGRYYPGTSAQVGIGIRAPGDYLGTAYAEWGYYDANNGFGFGVDAAGTYLFYLRATVKTKLYQAEWGVDTMDGFGPSEIDLSLANGNVFQINYSWYGYGQIEWFIVALDETGQQIPTLIHRYRPTDSNSIQNPNLPITVDVSNGDTTTDYDVYVGGRQYSIYGRYVPSLRRTHERRLLEAGVTTTFEPLITFRRKAGFEGYPVKFHEVNLISDGALVWEMRISGALTGASFGTPTNVSATETCLEADIAATAITGGELIEAGLVNTSGTGINERGGFNNDSFSIEVPGTEEVTLCVRTLTGTATVTSVLGMEEEW